MENELSQVEIQKHLMEAVGFNHEDVTANAQGGLTTRQCARLNARQQRWTFAATISLIVGIALAAAIIATPVYGNMWQERLDEVVIVLILSAFLAGSSWRKRRHYQADIQDGKVNTITGLITLSKLSRAWEHSVAIQQEWFGVNRHLYDVFEVLQASTVECIVYYSPRSKVILSVNPLYSI